MSTHLKHKPRTLADLVDGIAGYLKMFERDPVINARPIPYAAWSFPTLPPYGSTSARRTRSGVALNYSALGTTYELPREQAERYLVWLEAGNVGKHIDMPAEDKS